MIVGKTIRIINQTYMVVLDRVSVSTIGTDDTNDNSFVFAQLIVNQIYNLELSFSVDLDNLDVQNPLGFWHCIFNNYKFDFSQDFKYKVKNGDEFLFVEFNKNNKELKTIVNAEYIDADSYKELPIDNIIFSNIEIIQTDLEKKQEKYSLYKKITAISSIIPILIIVFYTYNYFKHLNDFSNNQKQLSDLIKQESQLFELFNNRNDQKIKKNINPEIQLSALFLLVNNNINFSTKINFNSEKNIIVTIQSKKLDITRFLFNKNNILVKLLSHDLVTQKAQLELGGI